ncbi:MAG TPA: AI-2E family transporter [Polyangiaceae bacterium]|nr:AI-2E family transporter [Polyangiaceae bacterium]
MFAVLACAIVAWIAMPLGIGILLGTLTAFAVQPVYQILAPRTGRPRLVAAACAAFAGIGIAGAMAAFFYLVVARGVLMAQALFLSLGPDGPGRAYVEGLAARLGPLQISLEDLATKLRDAAADVASRAALVAGFVAQAAFGGFMGLFFAVLTIYFILRNWSFIAQRAEIMLPLEPHHTHALFQEFREVGRSTLVGTVGTGLIQGGLATIGYWICGVPDPVFFGATTAVASLLPVVGTLFVWVPIGIFLLVTGQTGKAIVELAYGAVIVVGLTDYLIRPRLVGAEGDLPVLLTFVALFGGVEVFGVVGLILGPLLMSIAISLLRIYARESEARLARPSSVP